MWIDKTARELVKGDVLLNTGGIVDIAVPSHHGTKVYLYIVYDDGDTATHTVDADTKVATYLPDTCEGE